MKLLKVVIALAVAVTLTACGGGGGSAGTPIGAPSPAASAPLSPASAPANASVASILINTSASVLNADGTSSKAFTVYALTAGNASVSGATIDLSATLATSNAVVLGTPNVVLSIPKVVTGDGGATFTMTALASDQTNRTITLTASCSVCSASPATNSVTVKGATLSLVDTGTTSLIVDGSAATLSAMVRDVSGFAMSGITVSFAATDSGVLRLSSPTSMTNSSGLAVVQVSGLSVGRASINVSALGNAKTQTYISGLAQTVLAITSPANNASIVTNDKKTVTVSASDATQVTFSSTQGTFDNGPAGQSNNVVKDVIGGKATADFTAAQAGTVIISVNDNLLRSTNLTLLVSPPVSATNKILLNASQTTLPISTTLGSESLIILTARAVFFNGAADQAVANVPVQFFMTGGPGAGEFLTPALKYTDSFGKAEATFTAGTTASIPNGIKITAAVQGTAVKTGTSPSGNDVYLTIGNQALSVAFGPASVIGESSDKTLYIQAYSVQVADANNNPVAGKTVTLRMRPVAFSLGNFCSIIPADATYCSEDWNANGSLEAATEDGVRIKTTDTTAGSCPNTLDAVTKAGGLVAGQSNGKADSVLTPSNSDGGSVPSTVITDKNGIAAFDLTYLKGSSIWVVNKLTATVSSNGTETSKSTVFRLSPTEEDVKLPARCYISDSPYSD